MSFFFISLKITLAVVDIEIKHLNIYLNHPGQATLIYVNNPSPVPCPGPSAQLLKVGGIPFGYYLLIPPQKGGERQTWE